MIPPRAVEAALEISLRQLGLWGKDLPVDLIEARRAQLTEILEAAAPYIAGAWHDAVSEAYVEGALSLEQASAMWNKNPYRRDDAV